MVAATGIGSGDVVSATVGGARYGVVLLWAIAAGAFFKFVLSEGIARWQLATGKTALEGWADHMPAWVKYYFGAYLLLWTIAVSAALTNATGLGISNLTGGAIPQSWGAVLHSLIGFAFVYFGGYGGFEKMMKALVGVMGFAILACAILTFHDAPTMLRGLLIPTIPGGAGPNVLSLTLAGQTNGRKVQVSVVAVNEAGSGSARVSGKARARDMETGAVVDMELGGEPGDNVGVANGEIGRAHV